MLHTTAIPCLLVTGVFAVFLPLVLLSVLHVIALHPNVQLHIVHFNKKLHHRLTVQV